MMKKLSELLGEFQTLVLGTESEEGHPFSSYASFYYDGEVLYLFIPKITLHVENIQNNSKALLNFEEGETKGKQFFERPKVYLECEVEFIERSDARFQEFMPKFEGGTLDILIGTEGFNLYALTPTYGEATFDGKENYGIAGDKMNMLVVAE